MNAPAWLTFLLRSVALGVIISVLMLVLVPDLRQGSGLDLDWFGRKNTPPEKLSYYDGVSQAAPAVVNIYSNSIDVRNSILRRQQVETTSLGSGVIMTESGHILTCLHVIQNAESITVGLQSGMFAEANIVGFDPFTDLAVLKIDADNLHVIPQMPNPNTRIGDVVLAIGNPYNLGQTITKGIVSRMGRNVSQNFVEFIQTDAVLNEGNSGGALIDSNGYLVGINNAKFKTLDARRRVREVEGVSFAVPYQLAKRVMDEIIANGQANHSVLGFQGSVLPPAPGILVTNVKVGGPAYNAGLRVDDTIMRINDTPITSIDQALEIVANSTPGSNMSMEITREGEIMLITVIVGGISGAEL